MIPRTSFPWYLDGSTVRVKYKGKQLIGKVADSQVGNKGVIRHFVQLDWPILDGEQIVKVLIVKEYDESYLDNYNDELLEILD